MGFEPTHCRLIGIAAFNWPAMRHWLRTLKVNHTKVNMSITYKSSVVRFRKKKTA